MNQQPKWTPGPWFAGTGWIGAGDVKEGRVIARVNNFPYGDSEANARLIAAAPEMAALLEEYALPALNYLSIKASTKEDRAEFKVREQKVRALLARINGEPHE